MAQARSNPSTPSNPWLVLVVLTAGFFMILLDTTIVNVAIPSMSSADKGLNTTLDQILWVLNAYVLVYAATCLVSATCLRSASPFSRSHPPSAVCLRAPCN